MYLKFEAPADSAALLLDSIRRIVMDSSAEMDSSDKRGLVTLGATYNDKIVMLGSVGGRGLRRQAQTRNVNRANRSDRGKPLHRLDGRAICMSFYDTAV